MAQRLIGCGAVRFGAFTLTSGAKSEYYVDVKAAMGHPDVLRAIGEGMAKIARSQGPFDAVAGMELGAVPIASAVSLAAGLPLLIVRKGERQHGTGRRIEGALQDLSGKRVLVVEDVTTSGGSTAQAIELLRAEGAVVEHACSVVDRASGAVERFTGMHVRLHPLATVAQLLEHRATEDAA